MLIKFLHYRLFGTQDKTDMEQMKQQAINCKAYGSVWLVLLAALFWGLSGGVAGRLMAEGQCHSLDT
ncbi:hypothetical protein INT08_04950 [Prosthecochloris sp. N3]|uniref:Uncharacterized protein n=1 Tax=Prosthecochloris ethylica TaxID=2743976 RepID=A0ABR9XRK9_9CHLB|nr:hypothetical protein [Prosthecochloris ethylica]MBF0586073.1 hypothetical protein [Prosthecochloris ethylica]MBF0636527.1 hypothetical protein [Prosthecochloris ethylica]NUK47159.1 hypothetical protein [Prosthecochloris ethylica]